jgi:predicted methyltransferase
MVDLDSGLGNPFKPEIDKPVPFVFHDPAGFAKAYELYDSAWQIMVRVLLIFITLHLYICLSSVPD